jgi:MFS family permease
VSDTRLLKQGLFVRFLTSQLTSGMAIQMMLIGLGWQVYLMTESAMALGWVGLARYVPQILFTLHAGDMADRYDRHKVMIWSRVLLLITIGALSLTSFTETITEGIIYIACFMLGVSRTFSMPAGQAMVPNLVPRQLLTQAMTLTASARETITIIGPALGGVIYIFGAGTLYATSMLFVLISIVTLFGMKDTAIKRDRSEQRRKELFEGFVHVWRNKPVWGSLMLDTLAVLIGSVTALLPMIAHDILQTDSVGLGLLRSAPAAGAVAMSFLLAKYPIQRHSGRWLYAAVWVFGLGTLVFGFSEVMWVSLTALFVLGAADMISVVIRSTLVQVETPDEMRGRVSAVNSLFIATSNQLGEFESGALAAWIGAVPSILFGGFGTLALVALWIPLYPTLWNRDHLVTPESETEK